MLQIEILESDPMVCSILQEAVSGIPELLVMQSHSIQKLQGVDSVPDLVMGELNFPDGNLLDWIRKIRVYNGALDFMPITGDRRYETYKQCAAMGAIDYIIKPFTLERVRRAIIRYQDWRKGLPPDRPVEQEALDAFYLPKCQFPSNSEGLSRTYEQIVQYVQSQDGRSFTAQQAAEVLKMSPITVRRYLERMQRQGDLEVRLEYGKVGRPVNRYRKMK